MERVCGGGCVGGWEAIPEGREGEVWRFGLGKAGEFGRWVVGMLSGS